LLWEEFTEIFPLTSKVDILLANFRLLMIQCEWVFTELNITLYPFYAAKKMTHVAATVQKMRFVGSKVSFHII